jgi:hypothetical protein
MKAAFVIVLHDAVAIHETSSASATKKPNPGAARHVSAAQATPMASPATRVRAAERWAGAPRDASEGAESSGTTASGEVAGRALLARFKTDISEAT